MVKNSNKTNVKNRESSTTLKGEVDVSRLQGKILLDSSSNSLFLDVKDIQFIEVMGKTLEVVLQSNNSVKMIFKEEDYQTFLLMQEFIQVDEFLLVNINHIKKYYMTGIPYIELANGIKKRIGPPYHRIILRNIKKLEQFI